MAMHAAALYKDEAEKMRTVHKRRERQKITRKRQISQQQTLSVAEAQSLIPRPVQRPVEAIVDPAPPAVVLGEALPDEVPRGNRFGLPSCFICRGFDHTASECLKYK